MKSVKRTAIVCAVSAAGLSLTSLLLQANEQSAGRTVPVCVGSDGTLRAVSPGQSCPAGQQSLDLAEGGSAGGPSAPDKPAPTRKPDPVYDAAVDLHQRVRALEELALFEVVDKQGRLIFSVARGVARVYNVDGAVVASSRATDAGGFFTVQEPTGIHSASVGVSGSRGGLVVAHHGVPLIDVGKQEYGNFAMRFPAPGGGVVAAIGESRAGTGALTVGDISGWLKAWLAVSEDKGMVAALNGVTTLALLTEGASGGGLLTILDAGGEPVVKAGVSQDRYGIVLTGPAAGLPLVPRSGLPGSYIIGNAGR